MFAGIPFILKLTIASALFKRLWTTDAVIWFTYLKNSNEDFGVRMWQLLSFISLVVFLLVGMPLMALLVALLVSVMADTVARKLSELNGVAH